MKMKSPGDKRQGFDVGPPPTGLGARREAGLPCSELKMENRYMKARLTGPQANRAKPQVIPRRKVRLSTLRRFRSTCHSGAPSLPANSR